VITAAYFNAFVDLVHYMQTQQPGEAAANAPIASQRTTAAAKLHATASPASKIVYTLQPGAAIFPTGQRNGIWMEVDDENGNRGWISSALVSAR